MQFKRIEDYSIKREPEFGNLMIVRYRGRKIGQCQSEAGAKIIRRRHAQRQHPESE